MLIEPVDRSSLSYGGGQVSELLDRRDALALEDLIKCYRPLLKAMANRDLDLLIRRKVDVSDVVQDTCQDVASSFQKIEATNRNQFVGYLKTVLKNKIADCRRRFLFSQKRCIYRELPLGELDLRNSSERDGIECAQVDLEPIEKLIVDEKCDRLKVLLGRLPRELQRLLWWRFRKELTYREIGIKLSRNEDDVRCLVQRCLARMRSEVFAHDSTR